MEITQVLTTNIIQASVFILPMVSIFSFLPLSFQIFVAHPYFYPKPIQTD